MTGATQSRSRAASGVGLGQDRNPAHELMPGQLRARRMGGERRADRALDRLEDGQQEPVPLRPDLKGAVEESALEEPAPAGLPVLPRHRDRPASRAPPCLIISGAHTSGMDEYLEKLRSGALKLYALEQDLPAADAVAVRRAYIEAETGTALPTLGAFAISPERVTRRNCENMIGAVQVPVGVAGPLRVRGEHADGSATGSRSRPPRGRSSPRSTGDAPPSPGRVVPRSGSSPTG